MVDLRARMDGVAPFARPFRSRRGEVCGPRPRRRLRAGSRASRRLPSCRRVRESRASRNGRRRGRAAVVLKPAPSSVTTRCTASSANRKRDVDTRRAGMLDRVGQRFQSDPQQMMLVRLSAADAPRRSYGRSPAATCRWSSAARRPTTRRRGRAYRARRGADPSPIGALRSGCSAAFRTRCPARAARSGVTCRATSRPHRAATGCPPAPVRACRAARSRGGCVRR